MIKRAGVQRQVVLATGDTAPYNVRALEHPDVFRNRIERDVERLSELSHPRLAFCKPRDDGAPCGVGKRRKRVIEVWLRNHYSPIWVNNIPRWLGCQSRNRAAQFVHPFRIKR